jgi:hypothetical protein
MVMPLEESAGQNHKIKIDNTNFKRVEYIKYLEITLANQNCNHKETKVKVNVNKVHPIQATKGLEGSRRIALLILNLGARRGE